ncbi:hypothetical protein LC593_35370 [Nostoc sp. CHAB 5844]|nr:hypothetical protein [Nostoc sp. CHAB 5844]
MNEVRIEFEDKEQQQSQVSDVVERTETSRTVAQNPMLKMGVIGSGVFLFVATIGGLINGSINALNTTSNKIEPTQQTTTEEIEPRMEEQKDKTLLALTSQSTELKNMRDKKAAAQPTATTEPTLKRVAPPPTSVRQQQQPYSVQRNPPPPPAPVSRARPSAPSRQTAPIQPKQITPPQKRLAALPTSKQVVDPVQQWQAVADMGSFSAPYNNSGLEQDIAEKIEGGIGENSEQKTNEAEVDSNGQRILVGSSTEGKLETPIVWSSEDESTQNYLVRITKELKASDGTTPIPVGSYLVVQVANTTADGHAQLYATAILINKNGDTQEKKLPENAVRILSSNGKLLKAQSGRGNDFMSTIFSAAIAGIAKAAEIQNRPSSSVITNSGGFSSSTITNNNQDALAGFGEGAFGTILQNIKTSNERQAQSLSNRSKVYAIEAGKTVRIYINQTISI